MTTRQLSEASLLVHIRRNQDSTCEQIARAFETEPPFVRPYLLRLRRAGKLESSGNTRGTKWRAV